MVTNQLRQLFAASCCVMLAHGAAHAVDAGSLLRETDQSLRAYKVQREQARLVPLPMPLVLAEQQTVSVNSFKFVGVNLLKPEQLQEVTQPFAHRALTQGDLDNLCSSVVDAYRQFGWVVRVYVPRQPIPSDTLTVQVLETISSNSSK